MSWRGSRPSAASSRRRCSRATSWSRRCARWAPDGSHLMLELGHGRTTVRAIWFRALTPGEVPAFGLGDRLRCAFKLNRNRWKGRESLQLMIEHAEPLSQA